MDEMTEREQYRTGHSIVRRAETPWTQRPNGRWTLHLDLSVEQMAVDWTREAAGSDVDEMLRIAEAVRQAIVGAPPRPSR